MTRIHYVAFASLLIASVAGAETPAERSQHPRNGLMADLVFRQNSDELVWGANRKLGRVAAWAKANPQGTIVLEGHASRDGAADYNMELSLRRAHAVRRELVEAGVPAAQLVIAGFGERGIQRGANRRVAVWATRADRSAALALLEARGNPIVRSGTEFATSTTAAR